MLFHYQGREEGRAEQRVEDFRQFVERLLKHGVPVATITLRYTKFKPPL